MNTPNTPADKPLPDTLLAFATRLHDDAFADPKIKVKPSWAESVDAASKDVDCQRALAAEEEERAATEALAKAEAQKAQADADEGAVTNS